MSRRRKGVSIPKQLTEKERNDAAWHLNMARMESANNNDDQLNDLSDLIDYSESQEDSHIVNDDSGIPSSKICRLSSDDYTNQNRCDLFNGGRFSWYDRGQYFLQLKNANFFSTTESNGSSLILLGKFYIHFNNNAFINAEELNRLEILYLRRKDDYDDCESEFEYSLVFDDAKRNTEMNDNKKRVECEVDLKDGEFYALNSKISMWRVVYQITNDENNTIECRVYVKEKIFDSGHKRTESMNLNIRILLKRFCNFDYNSYVTYRSERQNLVQFYEDLKINRNLNVMPDVQKCSNYSHHPDLVPFLRSYQKKAVQWMIWREKRFNLNQSQLVEDSLHPLFVEYSLNDQPVFYNPYNCVLLRERPEVPAQGVPGGILADEMGLGKTVEILALILLNPKISKENVTIDVEPLQQQQQQVVISLEIRDLVDELVGLVACKVETDLAFSQKALEQKKRKNILKNDKKKAFIEHQAAKKRDLMAPKLSCFCGKHDFDVDLSPRIQCQRCGNVQHKECVNWIWDTLNDYLCPHCRTAANPIESKTTLIISPSSICHQWHQEILKHIRSYALKVYIYEGVNADGFVQPKFLADFDIVITTYETLRSELNYLDLPHCNRFRHPKRFLSAPTPLTAVCWWRVCLDEAQMVEGLSKAATMCLRLPCINRWCVTGTPIQKSVNDLHGLLVFLGVEPYCSKDAWNSALFYPFLNGRQERIINVVAPLLWRTLKTDVLDQLGIPEQEQRLVWLEFSPIEEHFYRRTHEDCSRAINTVLLQLTDQDKKLKSLDRTLLDKIFRPLLKLRQACCHPQIVRGRFVTIQKNQTSMEEVLKSMIKKTKLECEDEHRAIVAALNGLAGLKQLRNEWSSAADVYRQVLQLCDGYSNKIRTDPLPKIHALHNLHELLTLHRNDIPPTCRDNLLQLECDEVKNKYLTKSLNSVQDCNIQMNEFYANTEEHFKKIQKQKDDMWFIEICARYRTSNDFQWELLNHITNVLSNSKMSVGCMNILAKIRDLNGLQMVLLNLYEQLIESRKTLCKSLLELSKSDVADDALLAEASVCHLRPTNNISLDSCPVCIVDRNFDDFEGKLFNFAPSDNNTASNSLVQNEGDDETVRIYGQLRKGTWADSPLEVTLKALYQFLSRHDRSGSLNGFSNSDLLESANGHLKLFEMMKKEFRALRASWMAIRDHVALRDELSIATEKFRFRTPADVVPTTIGGRNKANKNNNNIKNPSVLLHVIEPQQLEYMEMKLNLDKVTAENQLQQKLGQLSYLTNLENMPIDDEQGNPEECPVCRNALGRRWSLLTCGHTYCCDCIRMLTNGQLIKCPVCRQPTNRNNVTFVTTKRGALDQQEDSSVKVKGSHSTKVESIVKCLINIQRSSKRQDPSKCLVFSTWTEVLDIIAAALIENDMNFVMMTGNSGLSSQKKLNTFKESSDCNILLLPIHCGAKGLNIVEASHIILVEPLLNPAEEQQALGRVHRMGQKKRTIVHKFLIRGTIEEKLHSILGDTKADHLINDVDSPLTVGDLANLFYT